MTAAPWTMPIEAVRYLTDEAGKITLTRLAARHADIELQATVVMRDAGFIALVGYEEPGSPGRHEMPVTLSVHPRENSR